MASQSGNPGWMRNTANPSSSASAPNRNSTPPSNVGANASGESVSGGPYTGSPSANRGRAFTTSGAAGRTILLLPSIISSTSSHSSASPFFRANSPISAGTALQNPYRLSSG